MVSWVDTVVRYSQADVRVSKIVARQGGVRANPPARGISKLFKKEQLLELPIGKWYFCEYHEIMPLRQ